MKRLLASKRVANRADVDPQIRQFLRRSMRCVEDVEHSACHARGESRSKSRSRSPSTPFPPVTWLLAVPPSTNSRRRPFTVSFYAHTLHRVPFWRTVPSGPFLAGQRHFHDNHNPKIMLGVGPVDADDQRFGGGLIWRFVVHGLSWKRVLITTLRRGSCGRLLVDSLVEDI